MKKTPRIKNIEARLLSKMFARLLKYKLGIEDFKREGKSSRIFELAEKEIFRCGDNLTSENIRWSLSKLKKEYRKMAIIIAKKLEDIANTLYFETPEERDKMYGVIRDLAEKNYNNFSIRYLTDVVIDFI